MLRKIDYSGFCFSYCHLCFASESVAWKDSAQKISFSSHSIFCCWIFFMRVSFSRTLKYFSAANYLEVTRQLLQVYGIHFLIKSYKFLKWKLSLKSFIALFFFGASFGKTWDSCRLVILYIKWLQIAKVRKWKKWTIHQRAL